MWTLNEKVMCPRYTHANAFVIAYLQTCEILIELTPRDVTELCIGPNSSKAKVIPSYMCEEIDKHM
jgi:hypothetical protein